MANNFQRSLVSAIAVGVICISIGVSVNPVWAAERGERGSVGTSGSVTNGTSKASVSIQTEVNGETVENIHHEEISRDGESVDVYEESHYATSSSEAGSVNVHTSVRSEARTGANITGSTSAVTSESVSSALGGSSRERTEDHPERTSTREGNSPESVLLRYKSNMSAAQALSGLSASSSATATVTSSKPAPAPKRWWQRIKVFFYGLFIR